MSVSMTTVDPAIWDAFRDDSTEGLTQEQAAREYAQQAAAAQARALGMVVQMPGTAGRAAVEQPAGGNVPYTQLVRKRADADLPEYIDLDDADEEIGNRRIKVQGREFDIAPIKTGASRKMGWYQTRIQKLTDEMHNMDDEKRAMTVELRIKDFQEKLTGEMIPGFPKEILDEMPIGKYKRLMEIIDTIVRADMGLPSKAEEDREAEIRKMAGIAPAPNS